MYPMPGPSSQNEPDPSGHANESEGFSGEVVTWLIRFWIAAWLLGVLVALWESEATRLQVLHATTRLLNNIAKAIGTMAIATEQAYYETADSLR